MTKKSKKKPAGGGALQILPIGGLGEIGMNLTLYGVGDDWIAVDAGVQFADPWLIGAEKVLPDLDLLSEYRDRIKALVITHGHEDHIGAIPYFVQACPVPVYAPPFVCELIRLKATQFGSVARPDLRPASPGDVLDFGPITVEMLRVTHSIPDSQALVLRTPVGIIVHTGDFKIDPNPLDKRPFDEEGFRRVGDEGVRFLLSDSTNASVPGHTLSEREVIKNLTGLIETAKGRVIVSLFASNVFRVRAIAEVADKLHRRVALVGKSLSVYLDAAERAQLIKTMPPLVDTHQVDRLPDRDLLVICTGSQAEPRSALFRASAQDHPDLKIHAGDTIVLSSRMIPGNERPIHRMINNLTRLGADVIHERAAAVHASGHAQQDELRKMMELVRPRSFMPIHGEYSFLKKHAALAQEAGIADVRVLENGDRLEVTDDDAVVLERVPLRFHYVDGPLVGDNDELRLDERRRIGWTGVLAARLVAQRGRKKWRIDLHLGAVGVPMNGGTLLDEAAKYTVEQLAALPIDATRKSIEETLLGSLRAFFRRRLDRKPSVLPFIEIDGED